MNFINRVDVLEHIFERWEQENEDLLRMIEFKITNAVDAGKWYADITFEDMGNVTGNILCRYIEYKGYKAEGVFLRDYNSWQITIRW